MEGKLRKKIFFDLDGTLAEFRYVDKKEELYTEGYFLELKPHENVVNAFKHLCDENAHDIFILSAYLVDSKYAKHEKKEWVKKYISPSFKNIILLPCGESKAAAVETYMGEGVDGDCFLIDDYNLNLKQWESAAGKGTAFKLINDCNDRNGSWQGVRIYQNDCLEQIKAAISAKE